MDDKIAFPHCDPRVIHPKGVCQYCDESGLQEVREAWNIAFTGQPDSRKTPCPAEVARGMESLNKWHGNRPHTSIEHVIETLQKNK